LFFFSDEPESGEEWFSEEEKVSDEDETYIDWCNTPLTIVAVTKKKS
jgi:hypothetical protein